MYRSNRKFINHRSTSSSEDTERNIPVSQSLPANYFSTLCPRAPLHKPIASPKFPPDLTLSEVPKDFQSEFAGSKKLEKMSFSLRTYTGPAISSSMQTWGKSSFLTENGLRRQGVSSIKRIAGSPPNSSDFDEPHSMTTLSMMNLESKGSTSPDKVLSEGKIPWVKALVNNQNNEVFGSEDRFEADDELFQMEIDQ